MILLYLLLFFSILVGIYFLKDYKFNANYSKSYEYEVGQCSNCKVMYSLSEFDKDIINKPCKRCNKYSVNIIQNN